MRLRSHLWLRWKVTKSIQASTLYWSWCGDNSCGIQTQYLHTLPNRIRCFSAAVWEHPICSAKHRVVNRGSSSISCFKRSVSTSGGRPQRGKSWSSKLPFSKRLNQCCAVRMERTSLPIVLHISSVACVALWSRRNSWSKSTRIFLRVRFISSPLLPSTSIALLSFGTNSPFFYTPYLWRLLELSRVF